MVGTYNRCVNFLRNFYCVSGRVSEVANFHCSENTHIDVFGGKGHNTDMCVCVCVCIQREKLSENDKTLKCINTILIALEHFHTASIHFCASGCLKW